MEHIFKVGDKVIYEVKQLGNAELNGQRGTVVMVDNTGCPYTVKFDKPYGFSVYDERVPKKYRDRLWWCKEENLSLADDENTESEILTMEVFKWDDQKVERLKELIRAGRSTSEMCAVFGIDAKRLGNKVYELRKQDPTLPGGYKNGAGKSKEKPQLGELEQQMSEVITELKTENDNLKGEIKALTDKIAELESSITVYEQEIVAAKEGRDECAAELLHFQESSKGMSREYHEMRCELESQINNYLRLIARLSARVMELEA